MVISKRPIIDCSLPPQQLLEAHHLHEEPSEEDSEYDEDEEEEEAAYSRQVLQQARAYTAHMALQQQARGNRNRGHLMMAASEQRKRISKKLAEQRLKMGAAGNMPTVVGEMDGKEEKDGKETRGQVGWMG